jgi:predicted Fe-S protein YdhL (DUF1289 family)
MAIVSPCIKVCIIDPRSRLCSGCGRTLDEIARWVSLGEDERNRIMIELPRRRLAHGIAAPEAGARESAS